MTLKLLLTLTVMYVQTSTHTCREICIWIGVCVCVANWPRQMPHGMRFKNKPSPSQAKRADVNVNVDVGSSSGQNVLWLETLFSLVYGLPLHAEPGLMTTALRTCKLAARSLSLLLPRHLSLILSPLLTLCFIFIPPLPLSLPLALSFWLSLVLSVQSLPLSLFLNPSLPLPLMLIRKLWQRSQFYDTVARNTITHALWLAKIQ